MQTNLKYIVGGHIYEYVKIEKWKHIHQTSNGVKLDKSDGPEFDTMVKDDNNGHISAFPQGHYHLILLVELISDFQYNFKFETMFKRWCHSVQCAEWSHLGPRGAT